MDRHIIFEYGAQVPKGTYTRKHEILKFTAEHIGYYKQKNGFKILSFTQSGG